MILNKVLPVGAKAWLTKTGLKLAKHSPEIMVGAGIITVTAAAIYGVYVGLTGVEDILDEHNDILDNIHDAEDDAPVETIGASKASLYRKTAIAMIKLFAVPGLMLIIGDALIIGGYVIQARRTAEAVAALGTVTAAFAAYRANVVNDQGQMKDLEYYYGKEFVADMDVANDPEVDDDERREAAKRIFEKIEDKSSLIDSDWSFLFDERSSYYKDNNKDNRVFLISTEQYWNDMLQQRAMKSRVGWVMLNDILADLRLPKVAKGFNKGWTWDPTEEPTPPRISFGLDDMNRQEWLDVEPRFWLNFNVQPGTVSERLLAGGWIG